MENTIPRTNSTYRKALKQGLRAALQYDERVFLWKKMCKNSNLKTLVGYLLDKMK